MNGPLSASHFKARTRVPVSAVPSAVKLASHLAESCNKALTRFAAASWRVALDRIEETAFLPPDAYARATRFESASGSMTVHITLDRPFISAFIESVMGGNGSEAPFEMGERPLSAIETGALRLAFDTLADQMAQAFSIHFGQPFSHFREDAPATSSPFAQELASFRFLVNVFGHSGEIRICMARSELTHQIKATASEENDAQDIASCRQLQRQVGKSGVEFTVSLGPETLSVEDITGLTPGKLVCLSSTVSSPVTLWSGGVAAFQGKLARSGDRLAVSITAPGA
jgi:flagellar motor switch protein FliM